MKVSDALKAMMKSRHMTQTDVAEKIGKNQNSVAMYLRNADSMRLDNLMKMANVCGYDVVLVGRGNEGSYVLGANGTSDTNGASGQTCAEEGMLLTIRQMIREEIASAVATTPGQEN